MNGRTHAAIGCAIVPLTSLASGLSLPETAVLAAISTGFALGPDIDHPNSTITKSLGKPVHILFHGLSTAALSVLSSSSDMAAQTRAANKGIDPSHRALTHTLLFAVAMGGLGYLAGQNSWATAILAALCLVVCRTLVPSRWQAGILGGALAMVAFGAYLTLNPQHVGLAAGAGWLSHIIADSCTTAGVPVLWPIRIKGRNWWRLRTLGSWIYTGHDPDPEVRRTMKVRQQMASGVVVLVMNLLALAFI